MTGYVLVRDVKRYILYERLANTAQAMTQSVLFVALAMPLLGIERERFPLGVELVLFGIGFISWLFAGSRRSKAHSLPGVKAWEKMQKDSPRSAIKQRIIGYVAIAGCVVTGFTAGFGAGHDLLRLAALASLFTLWWSAHLVDWFIPH